MEEKTFQHKGVSLAKRAWIGRRNKGRGGWGRNSKKERERQQGDKRIIN